MAVKRKFAKGDVAIVTGRIEDRFGGYCGLLEGEVVDVYDPDPDLNGETVYVVGRETKLAQWIVATSLTPYAEMAEDPKIDYSQIHDYVWDGIEDDAPESAAAAARNEGDE